MLLYDTVNSNIVHRLLKTNNIFLFTICYFSKMCYCFFMKALLIFGRLVYNRQLRKSRFSYNY